MRDKIKDEDYYNDLLIYEKESIRMFEDAVNMSIIEKGELDRGTRNGYNILINSYDNVINLLYSKGEELDTIKAVYKKLLPYYSKMWNRKNGYIGLIKVLSLAVLLEIDKNAILELEEKLLYERFDDCLVNALLKKIDSEWKIQGENSEFDIYDCLKSILENKNDIACKALKEYLQERWYEIHSECAWYDSHKSNRNVYYGYWSFEAGAIAKMLNIDDSSLRDVQYYPYDLVHYKE